MNFNKFLTQVVFNVQVFNFNRCKKELGIALKKGIVFLIVIIISAVVWYFYLFNKPSSTSIKNLIPETSLFALQIQNLSETSELLKSQPWFEAIEGLPVISRILNQVEGIDSLQRSGLIKSSLSSLELWISVHTTSSDQLTPLYIVKSKGFDWQWGSIASLVTDVTGQQFVDDSQSFNGREIKIMKSADLFLAGLIEGSYLVFSENTLLVEDVVRSIQEEESRLLSKTDRLSSGSMLSLVVNSNRLEELSSVFYQDVGGQLANPKMNGNLILNLDINDEEVVFRGTGEQQGLSKSNPAAIFGKNLIPTVSSSFSWTPIHTKIGGLEEFLQNGVCTVYLNQRDLDPKRVHIFSVSDTTSVSNILSSAANEKLAPADSAVYNERFISSTIGYINDENYLGKLIGNDLGIKGAPFYVLFQQFLIVSDDLDALKTVLNDFDTESTWGRSIERRRILDDMVQETDLTYVQDFEFASDPLKERLKPKWGEFFTLNPQVLDALELFKLQLNRTSSSMLVSGNLAFKKNFKAPSSTESVIDGESDILANVFADATITTKPFVVRNHNNSQIEVVFQDSENNLYLMNKQGEVQWKRPLNGSLQGDVHQIDFYKNRKLQYLMFSDSLIYLIDRNGDDVDGFPKAIIAGRPFNGTDIIDYDNSKQYRYLAQDRRGDISLYSKEGELLEGWNPKSIGGPLLATPFHVRIRGRDCFVAIETSGKIHLLNRKGEAYQGFPVAIDGRFAGDVALTRGSNFNQTLISLMSEEGEFVQVNFEGDVLSKKQYVRPNTRTTFSLVYDALETTFNIVQNDGRTLTFFNDQGEESFYVDYPNSKEISVDLYNFRNGKEVFVIRDTKEKVMRIVNKDGRFLTSVIPNNERISILYYQNKLEYEVFVNFANQMNIYAVKPL